MTTVTLAVQYEGHAPDETITVPDHIARNLLYSGQARAADQSPAAPVTPKALRDLVTPKA